jgi:hypothetical protein
MLWALNIGCCIKEYCDVLSLDIVPSKSFTRYELQVLLGTPLVDGHMEKKLANVQKAMYSKLAPRVHFLYGWLSSNGWGWIWT